MKTSVIEVPDMLSALTVDEVEERYEAVAGVESATVNFAAGRITVRYDETLLTVADIGIFARQRGRKPADDVLPAHDSGIKSDAHPTAAATPTAAPVAAPEPAAQKAEPVSADMPMPNE